jgi:FtsP/CotA-like multicopper oxidase with cupredoxin domain
MNRRRFVVGTAAATGVGAALVAEGCSAIKSLAPLLPNASEYTLNVGYATSNVSGYVMRTRTYNGKTFGPTLVAYPGQTLSITINNQLPPNPPAVVPSSAHGLKVPAYANMNEMARRKPSGMRLATTPVDPMNNPHSFNTTNLHVHGIQTIPHLYDPVGTSDVSAMMVAIEPGTKFTYSFPIPSDHPSGLFWYHPHHHGSTDVQVSGGMAGLIVVPGPIDQVPEIAAAREIFMVIQSLQVNPAASGSPWAYEYEPVAYLPFTNPLAYTGGTAFTMMTVNGQGVLWINENTNAATPLTTPVFSMQPGEVVRLRLLNGTNGIYLPLVLPGMDAYVIANDGINVLTPLKQRFDFSSTVTQFNINDAATNVLSTSPGNRVELLIKAPDTAGTYTLSAAAQVNIEAGSGAFDLARFVVSGSPVSMSVPVSLPAPPREYPLIADSEIVTRRTMVFHEANQGNQPASFKTLLTGFYPWIDNGVSSGLFDEMSADVRPALGSAEEWTILNGTTCGHPFHIHVNSFQLMEINGKGVTPPQFYDTFMVPPAQTTYPMSGVLDGLAPPGQIKIRIRFKQWRGKSVFHCHVLTHEDTGMMSNMLIT